MSLPDTAQCCLDVAGSRCVAWISALFEAALAEHDATAIAINEAVLHAVGALVETDVAMGSDIRRSVGE
ncbi:hypothetical protein [Nocardia brasiliensis]|uniref:hypothetical protein n=1 Tax=Nocardia brasiliensis TaxID=37326 RepID=UPI003D8A282B